MNQTSGPSRILVQCPACGRPSDSVKCYRMAVVVFLLVFGSVSSWGEFGCPGCIRRKILLNSLLNLLTANLIWPVVFLPWTLVAVACSFRKGHSAQVRELIRQA